METERMELRVFLSRAASRSQAGTSPPFEVINSLRKIGNQDLLQKLEQLIKIGTVAQLPDAQAILHVLINEKGYNLGKIVASVSSNAAS